MFLGRVEGFSEIDTEVDHRGDKFRQSIDFDATMHDVDCGSGPYQGTLKGGDFGQCFGEFGIRSRTFRGEEGGEGGRERRAVFIGTHESSKIRRCGSELYLLSFTCYLECVGLPW